MFGNIGNAFEARRRRGFGTRGSTSLMDSIDDAKDARTRKEEALSALEADQAENNEGRGEALTKYHGCQSSENDEISAEAAASRDAYQDALDKLIKLYNETVRLGAVIDRFPPGWSEQTVTQDILVNEPYRVTRASEAGQKCRLDEINTVQDKIDSTTKRIGAYSNEISGYEQELVNSRAREARKDAEKAAASALAAQAPHKSRWGRSSPSPSASSVAKRPSPSRASSVRQAKKAKKKGGR